VEGQRDNEKGETRGGGAEGRRRAEVGVGINQVGRKGKGTARDRVLYSYRKHPRIGGDRITGLYNRSTRELVKWGDINRAIAG